MKVCVLGLGYVGLPTAAVLAKSGHEVLGVDINKKVVNTINKGDIHIYEPDLDIIVKKAVQENKIRASMVPENSDVYLIVVPTPLSKHKEPDMKYVNQVVYSVIPHLTSKSLLILESTSPVGSTEKIQNTIRNFRPDLFDDRGNPIFYLAHCPERVLPGNVIVELIENDRVVGGINKKSTIAAKSFYETFVKGKIYCTDSKTAEMTKLVENAFRDVNIAFANELSMICDENNINVLELIELANKHPRVNILKPGAGVGGHCIAVDPWFVVAHNKEKSKLIKTAREINDFKTQWVIKKVLKQTIENNRKVCCFGLTYKQDIDDTREAPGIKIFNKLVENLGSDRVICCEPHLKKFGDVDLYDLHRSIECSDVLVFCVPHKAFKDIDKSILSEKIIIDVCGVFEGEK